MYRQTHGRRHHLSFGPKTMRRLCLWIPPTPSLTQLGYEVLVQASWETRTNSQGAVHMSPKIVPGWPLTECLGTKKGKYTSERSTCLCDVVQNRRQGPYDFLLTMLGAGHTMKLLYFRNMANLTSVHPTSQCTQRKAHMLTAKCQGVHFSVTLVIQIGVHHPGTHYRQLSLRKRSR